MFKSFLWLEEVSSTQQVIRSLPHRSLVVANRQTSGRGRQGRLWHSQEGGLYLSFSLPRGIKDEGTLPLVVASSVADCLESLGFLPAIKWVNDVYLRGKKVCGVLVEGLKDRILVGIGINLNQEGFPPELEATSLRLISGKTYNKVDFLLTLLDFLSAGLNRLEKLGFQGFKDSIENRLLFKDAEVILYTPEPKVGILQGIGDDGSLLLMTQEGLKRFQVGDITLRPL